MLGILPLVALVQVGFLVSFGVLLDALLVRSILVPAITFDLGKRIWWPGQLSRKEGTPDGGWRRREGQPCAGTPLTVTRRLR